MCILHSPFQRSYLNINTWHVGNILKIMPGRRESYRYTKSSGNILLCDEVRSQAKTQHLNKNIKDYLINESYFTLYEYSYYSKRS